MKYDEAHGQISHLNSQKGSMAPKLISTNLFCYIDTVYIIKKLL